jgi:hypothetical protein
MLGASSSDRQVLGAKMDPKIDAHDKSLPLAIQVSIDGLNNLSHVFFCLDDLHTLTDPLDG